MNFRPPYDFPEGTLLLVNKPLDWTSFDVVNKLKYATQSKVGHAGTLDPLATGLLIVATGKFTKKLGELQGLNKTYTGTIQLGFETDTYDAEGEKRESGSFEDLMLSDVETVAIGFLGDIEQVPPVYSAIKIKGKAAYKRARAGEEVKVTPRKVTIEDFQITGFKDGLVSFEVSCSKGTYIRSLAHDLGQQLGCGAYLASLCRTSIGPYELEDAWELEELIKHINNDEHAHS
jgi:tRNA pseudouridine55 synthase